ncbi:glycosyltransferase [Mucilaginibacter sp. CSA2-8R]|uniref:glycosyltransferase n=1 Tax=Mucilaginibacter sp. CSA2-8R TaxID=3141542 RepID=UPI00315D10E0
MTQHNFHHASLPLISVIITNYNHGKYLSTAINSVLSQSYLNFEVIVIDDGSTDDSRSVIERYQSVKYIFQTNQGLSAARNKGIDIAAGEYLVFLDADDWLYNNALSINAGYLSGNDDAAFAYGAHQIINTGKGTSVTVSIELKRTPYQQLLQGNYIGMHATVMYRKWVLQQFKFDVTLKACEDYDLYLRIAKKHPVIHHQQLIAAYMHHGDNMSFNHSLMLNSALHVLDRFDNDPNAEQDHKAIGTRFWKNYYTIESALMLEKLPLRKLLQQKESLRILAEHNRLLLIKLLSKKGWQALKSKCKSAFLRGSNQVIWPPINRVNLGDLNRITPFSLEFGYDRGGPVDRFYIEKFLAQNSHAIKGRVLEIGDNEYTLKFGLTNVVQSDILHIDDSNTKATFVGDLSNAPMLPDNSFDCIVLTQTLHLIYNYIDAIKTCYRVLKPGGSLLLTVPGISHIAHDQWGKYWFWSFTDASITRLLTENFDGTAVIDTHGNVLAATAFLYGMGRYELSDETLNSHDPHYQVIITAACRKLKA